MSAEQIFLYDQEVLFSVASRPRCACTLYIEQKLSFSVVDSSVAQYTVILKTIDYRHI